MTMIPNNKDQNSGRQNPLLKFTLEQDFKLRVIEDNLRKHYDKKEEVITVFLALQRQNFALSNSLKDLIQNSIII